MKKLFTLFFLIIILVGCSAENLSLEEQIRKVMSENNLRDKEIIDYDIKDDFVYVIFKNSQGNASTHYPDLVILKNNNGTLEWEAGPNDRTTSVDTAMIFGRENGPSVTLILEPSNATIKEIKILGDSAKAVSYVEQITDDFSKVYTYWIAYTNQQPAADDIEYIME
ncbi:hypothetical protein OEV98_05975 [Caldibacillus lycopersici]|uniref:Lipoprotein n=1 Tax=Perspicuibacillus lycopersici TaxID=1325689 RepID=A0AAE3IRX6_9BACI|nr:hypothetical protein [Perspicuibacillus lycopersici]MCU9613097.1 hypothetical protein [Perspicuibacillus lycopersici]